jgi:hypothetical protein
MDGRYCTTQAIFVRAR